MDAITEQDLASLQNDAVAELALASSEPKHALTGAAAALLLAIPALCDEVRWLRERSARLGEALAFAKSVIKSGESWTPRCEEMLEEALTPEQPTEAGASHDG